MGRRQAAGLLAAGALGALAGAAGGLALGNRRGPAAASGPGLAEVGARTVAFFGEHQGGIATPSRPQAQVWVSGLDLAPGVDAAGLRQLLQAWSAAAAALAAGRPLGAVDDPVVVGLGPAALTVTVGFGPTLFGKAGLPASARPGALAPLPAFAGERLDPAGSDGDLGLVVAADDPDFAARVFATGPAWMRGGSYLVVRRIRMLLDDWDTVPVADQERVIGRRKDTGAPLSGGDERTAANFGSPAIPPNAHMRLAAPAFNQGAAMLRRGFSYVDGAASGLLFLAWQADPRRGFIPVQQRLVGVDALGRYIRHETSALFAMPAGVSPGSYVGQLLLEGW